MPEKPPGDDGDHISLKNIGLTPIPEIDEIISTQIRPVSAESFLDLINSDGKHNFSIRHIEPFDFQKTFSRIELPFQRNGLHIITGNEDGEASGQIKGNPFVAITDRGIDSGTGIGKKINQDGFLVDEESGTIIIWDGIGGYEYSHIATTVAAITAAGKFEQHEKQQRSHLALPHLAIDMNKNIRIVQAGDPTYESGLGTTLAMMRLYDDMQGEILHLGDSRISVLRLQGDESYKLTHLTKDHTKLNHLIGPNKFEDEEAVKIFLGEDNFLRFKNTMTCALGVMHSSDLPVKTTNVQFQPGDIMLATTDGLILSDEEIEDHYTQARVKGSPVDQSTDSLVNKAIKHMRKKRGDNVTCVACELKAA